MSDISYTADWRNKSNPNDPWSVWHNFDNSIYADYTVTDSKNGSVTPNHNRLVNAGHILPVNPYAISSETIYRQGMLGVHTIRRRTPDRNYWSWEERYTNFYPVHDVTWVEGRLERLTTPSVPESLIQQAVNDAISNATQSLVMAPVSALEARETLHMLKNSVKRLLKFATFIRELAKRRKESFSALWLEYRLGWTPFYYDLVGYVKIMNKGLKKGERQHGSGLRAFEDSNSESWSTSVTGWQYSEFESFVLSTKIRGFALAEVTDETAARYGLNPLLVVWESITLSWLLDKFISIGTWLAALSNSMSGFSLRASGVSVKVTLEAYKSRAMTPVPQAPGYGAEGGIISVSFTKNVRSFTRTPDSGGGFPYFNRHFSAVSITDILALIAQWNGYRI